MICVKSDNCIKRMEIVGSAVDLGSVLDLEAGAGKVITREYASGGDEILTGLMYLMRSSEIAFAMFPHWDYGNQEVDEYGGKICEKRRSTVVQRKHP